MEKNIEKKREFDALRQEISQLEKEIFSLLEKIKLARLDGDISEDGNLTSVEQHGAFKIEKISRLRKKLMAMEKNIEKKKIVVTYQSLENGKVKAVELVSEWEADHSQGKISSTGPLGSVLANKKVGEIGEVITKQKRYKVQILQIEEK